MSKIKKGDIVGRVSYGKDIVFRVSNIIKTRDNEEFAILKGITIRIEADAPIADLEVVEKEEIDNNMRILEDKLKEKIKQNNTSTYKKKSFFIKRGLSAEEKRLIKQNGKILHLDGDSKYAEKSLKYYKQLGLNAVVKSIPENEQHLYVYNLLNRYKPDILVITGHDGMIKNGSNYNDIYNYRNSRHFIRTVKEARRWGRTQNELVIFAGACQSYYEAIMSAGSDFASSPARILIDFLDPLIVARKIATTESTKYITIKDIAPELKDGNKGIGGIRTIGKRKIRV